jgi:hypothetical protein
MAIFKKYIISALQFILQAKFRKMRLSAYHSVFCFLGIGKPAELKIPISAASNRALRDFLLRTALPDKH